MRMTGKNRKKAAVTGLLILGFLCSSFPAGQRAYAAEVRGTYTVSQSESSLSDQGDTVGKDKEVTEPEPEKPANYKYVDYYISMIPENLKDYSDRSVKAVEDALARVDRTKTESEQAQVNQMTKDLRIALCGLTMAGWHTTEAGVKYCKKDGETWLKNGWARIGGKWFYFSSKGYRKTGWLKEGDLWYYLNKDGIMQTGWVQVKGAWYFMNNSGIMQTGWLKLKNKSYYLASNGKMTTGWKQIDNIWYYFNSSGRMVKGWQKDKDDWYFLSGSGQMAKNGWLVQKGISYHFAANGKLDRTTKNVPLTTFWNYYVSPMYAGQWNTAEERIEAMIQRAYDYKRKGTRYKICKSMAPGQYADCSGLVMQCLYAAGFDPTPATPPHHALPENEYDSRTLFYKVNMRHVDVSDMKRGDLIFYRRPNTNIINHVAIYLGDGKVIESWPPAVTDQYSVTSYPHTLILGVARPFE